MNRRLSLYSSYAPSRIPSLLKLAMRYELKLNIIRHLPCRGVRSYMFRHWSVRFPNGTRSTSLISNGSCAKIILPQRENSSNDNNIFLINILFLICLIKGLLYPSFSYRRYQVPHPSRLCREGTVSIRLWVGIIPIYELYP